METFITDTIPALNLVAFGFCVGLGWYLAKAVFVIIISKWVAKEPIKLDTQD